MYPEDSREVPSGTESLLHPVPSAGHENRQDPLCSHSQARGKDVHAKAVSPGKQISVCETLEDPHMNSMISG